MTDREKLTLKQALPWRCPRHPHAQIRHWVDQQYYVYGDGYPRGTGHFAGEGYECAECGEPLCAPPMKARQSARQSVAKEVTK